MIVARLILLVLLGTKSFDLHTSSQSLVFLRARLCTGNAVEDDSVRALFCTLVVVVVVGSSSVKTESLNVYKLLQDRSGPRALLRSTDGAAKHVAVQSRYGRTSIWSH